MASVKDGGRRRDRDASNKKKETRDQMNIEDMGLFRDSGSDGSGDGQS